MILIFASIIANNIFFSDMVDYLEATLSLNSKRLTHLMLRNNLEIKKKKLQIKEIKINELKNEAKFDWNLILNSQYYSLHLPENDSNLYTGNKNSRVVYSASLQKKFKADTTLQLEARRIRQDSNAFESARNANIIQNYNAFPVIFTDSLKVTLSQEFLRSNFGEMEKRNIKILQLNQKINNKNIFYDISKTLNNSLANFWNLKLIELNLKSTNQKYKNTQNLYYISNNNRQIGLNKNYNPYLWNGELLRIRNEILKLEQKKKQKLRLLQKSLNLNKRIKLVIEDEIIDEFKNLEFEQDYKYALKHRADIYVLKKKKDIIKHQIKMAYLKRRPSLSLKVEYSPIEQSNKSDVYKFVAKQTEKNLLFSPNTENKASINFSHRLNQNDGEIKELKNNYKKIKLDEDYTKLKIQDELLDLKNNIDYHKQSIKQQKEIRKETRTYYYGLLKQFRVGNVNSTIIKNALDSFIDSTKELNRIKINYQILLFQYMLAKNSFFTESEITSLLGIQ